jgi:hypothetical protein
LFILQRPAKILQHSATMRPDFRISYCNKHFKIVHPRRWKSYGEYVCNAFHLILKYSADGQMIVLNDRNMQLVLNEK